MSLPAPIVNADPTVQQNFDALDGRLQTVEGATPSSSEATTVSDTSTLNLTLTGTDIHGDVLDSPLLNGQAGAYYLARANHTGSQLAATISDFTTAARAAISVSDTATLDLSYAAGAVSGAVLDSPLLQGNNSAYHLARANHTGTQLAATISDFTTAARAAISVSDTSTLDLTYAAGAVSGAVLDSPLLQGQNSAYHLARANHTGTQLAATVSDFSTAVTALLTDANIPDTITLSNITQITTRPHASLTSLSADDHTQYALLAGRSGGQTLQGDTAASGILTLQSTANATRGTIDLRDKMRIWTEGNAYTGTGSNGLFRLETAFSSSTTNSIIRFIDAVSTITHNNDTTNAMQLFRNATTFTPSGTRSIGNLRSFVSSPTITSASASTTTVGEIVGLHSGVVLSDIAGGGTGTVTRVVGAQLEGGSSFMVGAGWTVTSVWGCRLSGRIGTGTVTNMAGLYVEDIVGLANTVVASVYSIGAAVPCRHAGPAVFGSSGVPNTTTDVNGDFATRAANLALANGANNNIAIGARSFIRITGPTAAFSITGIASGFDGKNLVIYNTTAQNMTISNNSASSTAANRIITGTGADVVTAGTGAISFIYDATQSLWICIGTVL